MAIYCVDHVMASHDEGPSSFVTFIHMGSRYPCLLTFSLFVDMQLTKQ